MIDKKTVEKVARLSYIKLTDEELEKYTEELKSILGYMDILEKIDVSSVEPVLGNTELEDVLREDKAGECATAADILKLAPEREGDYFKTKTILN